jgi:hypothetical protein
MKTKRNKLTSALVALALCAGMIIFPACDKDDDEDDMKDDDPCEQMECLNGGNAIRDVELGGCRCICPAGFSGENCEIQDPE